ncbi:hypothetical protein [Streptomyces sp. SGAir0957]
MTDIIRAPWTPNQVEALNRFQREGDMHPFTCGGEHTPGSPVLIAREDGWRCPEPYGEPCDYRQDWAHAFMADPARWPLSRRIVGRVGLGLDVQAATQATDLRQSAYDAVWDHIRALGQHLPSDTVHRNAMIWRAVHAALDAAVGPGEQR